MLRNVQELPFSFLLSSTFLFKTPFPLEIVAPNISICMLATMPFVLRVLSFRAPVHSCEYRCPGVMRAIPHHRLGGV